MPWRLLADVVLTVHVAVVVFVFGGLVLIVAGNLRGWRWVNSIAFRVAHLGAIAIVVAEVWLGLMCPLTVLEAWLRMQAGSDTHRMGFLEYWFSRLLFYDLPPWVFAVVYSVFGLLVLAAWFRYPATRTRAGTPPTDETEARP